MTAKERSCRDCKGEEKREERCKGEEKREERCKGEEKAGNIDATTSAPVQFSSVQGGISP